MADLDDTCFKKTTGKYMMYALKEEIEKKLITSLKFSFAVTNQDNVFLGEYKYCSFSCLTAVENHATFIDILK